MSEIIEQGISAIEYRTAANFNRVHRPADGVAKWFKDGLDQIWVKFTTKEMGVTTDHVVLASRVVEVRYDKTGK